jgi:hypothetical protein
LAETETSLGRSEHQREKYKEDDELICPVEKTRLRNRLLTDRFSALSIFSRIF